MSDDKVERHIDKVTLTNLFNADMVAQRAAAEERGAIASRIKGLAESHHLDLTAYRIAKSMAKLPDGKREATYRAVMLYCDMLDVCAQGEMDLDDKIAGNVARSGGRTDTEAMMDGEGREAGTVESRNVKATRGDAGSVGSILRPNTPSGDAALAAFKAGLEEVTEVKALNEGLDRFTKDNPYLAEPAGNIAIARITAIELAQSDGEDERPAHLKNAATTEAKQIVKDNAEAVKAKPGKARGDRKPKAAKAGAQASVH